VRSDAVVRTGEPEGLALRMAKHFAHKVEVEQVGAITRVRLPTGTFELEPGAGVVGLRASAEDQVGLERVQEVARTHLERFARGEELEISWRSSSAR
jgi:hypothetical protein